MTSYHQINDQTYDFLTSPDLKVEILLAGRKKLIFVEGYDDKVIFDIIYKDLLIDFEFIDISLEKAKQHNNAVQALGGCEAVKQTLIKCIENIPIRKCFGIIDRDLKTDEEIDIEKLKPCYNNQLFVFLSRYTIENYFIEPKILKELIRDCSVNNKKLIPLNSLEQIKEIIESILINMAKIGAANLTIRSLDNTKRHLEDNIKYLDIESRLKQRLSQYPEELVLEKWQQFIIKISNENPHKYANAKAYFSYQFNLAIKSHCNVNLQINNNKPLLARIFKDQPLHQDFKDLKIFLVS